jgi:ribosomal protein S18 acetylase RimI-like enzyme
MRIQIRPATPEDYGGLCTILDEVDALHRDQVPHIYHKPPGPVREPDYLLGVMADPDQGLYVAEAGQQIVAVLHVVIRDTPPVPLLVPRRFAVVDNLVVSGPFRRAGIGQALMEQAYRWAAARGATRIELTVYEFNKAAIAFYQSLGYRILSHRMAKSL